MQNLKQMEEYKKSKKSNLPNDPEDDDLEDEIGDDEENSDISDDTPIDSKLPVGDSTTDGNIAPISAPLAPPVSTPLLPADNGGKPYMVITNLKKIADQANQLVTMISTGMVEPWAADHITTSADDVEEVYNYYKYKD